MAEAPGNPASAAPAAGTPATPPAAPATTTTATAAAAPPAEPKVEQKWPDDWREQLAGSDEKYLKRLQRYNSPRDVANALVAVQTRISAGELRSSLPKDAKPEEIAKWREENGIPDKPEGYDLKDIKVDAEYKPLVDSFLKMGHQMHLPPETVKQLVNWRLTEAKAEMDRRVTEQNQKDSDFARETEDDLRTEWGNEYRANLNRIDGLLAQAPQGVKDLLLGGRLSDGSALGSHPQVLRWLAGLARELNPAASVIGAGGEGAQATIDAEIERIEKVMKNDRAAYNADEKMQARLRDLYEARERMSARAA